MHPADKPSPEELAKQAKLSMNGLTDEQWNSRHISRPLTKQEFLAYLRKIGQLPPNDKME